MIGFDVYEEFANECDAKECAKELTDNEALCLDVVEVVQIGREWILRVKVNVAQGESGSQYDVGHCHGFIWGYKRAMEIRFMMGTVREQEDAQRWLIENDPEAAKYWADLPLGTDFVSAMEDNLRDFGDPDGLKKQVVRKQEVRPPSVDSPVRSKG